MSAKPERWTRDELRALIRDLKENARENRQQATVERDREKYLEGGAEAFEYAAQQVSRVLKGRTQVEDLSERIRPYMSPKA
jgi:hypothetical protein